MSLAPQSDMSARISRIPRLLVLLSLLTPALQAPDVNKVPLADVEPTTFPQDEMEIEGVTELRREVPQIPKCCPLGESILDWSGKCVTSNLTFDPEFKPLEGQVPPVQVDLLIGDRCKYGRYRLEPKVNSEDEFYLLPNGYLFVPFLQESHISPYDYCLESFLDQNESTIVLPLVCFPPPAPENPWKSIAFVLYPIGCLISVPFLAATVFIYLYFKELRNLQGKVLSCYSTCLAVAYLCLACVQIWGDKMDQNICIVVAFMIQFFFMACFFWLNVMCFHTWKRITSTEKKKGKVWPSKRRIFTYYSIYGWGLPLALLFISLVMDLMPTIPSSYIKPNFGIEACWFQNDSATLSYFYGPISLLLMANVVFFVLTIRFLHASTPKADKIVHMQDVARLVIINRKRQMLVQVAVLFCVMGLNWVLEVLSWGIGKPPQLWVVIDFFNTLQGAIVFLVFVLSDEKVKRLALSPFRRGASEPVNAEQSQPLNQP